MNSRACKIRSSLQGRITDDDKVVITGCNHVQKKFAINLRGRLLKDRVETMMLERLRASGQANCSQAKVKREWSVVVVKAILRWVVIDHAIVVRNIIKNLIRSNSKRMNSRELTLSRYRSSKRVEESKHAMKRNAEFQGTKEVDYDFSSRSKSISECGCVPSHLQKQFVLSVLFATSNHRFNARPQITIEKARSSCLEQASTMYQAIPRDEIVVC